MFAAVAVAVFVAVAGVLVVTVFVAAAGAFMVGGNVVGVLDFRGKVFVAGDGGADFVGDAVGGGDIGGV